MASILSSFSEFRKLGRDPAVTADVIRLMMACNDLTLANHSMKQWKQETRRIDQHARRGAGMYFVRLQCAHLHEAFAILQRIERTPELYGEVERCSLKAKKAFEHLAECFPGRRGFGEYKKHIGLRRNKVAFHYDREHVVAALRRMAGHVPLRLGKITVGDDLARTRFEIADDVVDTIVCRQLSEVPDDADVREEMDQIAEYGENLCKMLFIFAVEFVSRHLEHCRAK